MQISSRKSRFEITWVLYNFLNQNFFSDDDSIFQMYSQKSCIFECSLNFAIRTVGCLPWDFPIPTKMKATDILVCHSSNEYRYGKNNKLIQFFNAMKNQTILRNCSCLPDCETIAYDTQEKKILGILGPTITYFPLTISRSHPIH